PDDVAQPPPAARPGIDELIGWLIAVATKRILETIGTLKDGRGDLGRGGLGENPDDVVPAGDAAVSAVPPVVVGDAGRDAAQPFAGHVQRGAAADGVDARDNTRVEIGIERIAVRRNEEPLLRISLLMDVPQERREPL